MANATIYVTGRCPAASDTGEDPFHDPVMIGIGIAVLVITLVMLGVGGAYYWGALYGVPSWSTHSFPPPLLN